MNSLDFAYSPDGQTKLELCFTSDEKITTASLSTMSTYIYMLFVTLKQVAGIDADVDVEAIIKDLMNRGEDDPHCH